MSTITKSIYFSTFQKTLSSNANRKSSIDLRGTIEDLDIFTEKNDVLKDLELNLKGTKITFSSEKLNNYLERVNQLLEKEHKISYSLLPLPETLGEGAFGYVSKVFDLENRIFYAKKVLKQKGNFNYIALCEIIPILYLIKINDSRLLKILKIDYQEGENLEILMECGIGSLSDFIKFITRKKVIYESFYDDLLTHLKIQLETLKTNMICHRDIKPDNIIVTKGLEFKLSDYGSAEKIQKVGYQEMLYKGTEEFMLPCMREAAYLGKCNIDPFEADDYALELTLKIVKQKLSKHELTVIEKDKVEDEFYGEMTVRIYEELGANNLKDDLIKELFENYILKDLKLKLESELEKLKFDTSIEALHRRILILDRLGDANKMLGSYDQSMNYYERSLSYKMRVHCEDSIYIADSYNKMGQVYENKGCFEESIKFLEKCEIILTNILPNSPELSDCLHNKGALLQSMGKYDEAKACYKGSLIIDKSSREDINIARTYNNLGIVCRFQGLYSEALEYFNKALELIREHGSFNPEIGVCYNNIGEVYAQNGMYDKAIEYLERSKNIYTETLGENHPLIAVCLNLIGCVMLSKEAFDSAFKYFNMALQLSKEKLGEDHPHVGICLNSIGNAYLVKNEFDMAIQFYHQSINLIFQKLGENHPEMSIVMHNLGDALRKKGLFDESKQAYLKSLQISQNNFGDLHPNISISYAKLGSLYLMVGKTDEAFEFYMKSLEINEKNMTGAKPLLAKDYKNLGKLFEYQKKLDEAQEFYEKSLNLNVILFGENHEYIAYLLSDIASVLNSKEEYQKSIDNYIKAIGIIHSKFGENHHELADHYINLGIVLDNYGKHQDSVQNIQKGLELMIRYHGEKNSNVIKTYQKLGNSYMNSNQIKSAIKYYTNSLRINVDIFGDKNGNLMNIYYDLGIAYLSDEGYETSIAYLKLSIELIQQNCKIENELLSKCYSAIGEAYENLNKLEEAKNYFVKSLNVDHKLENPQCEDVNYSNLGNICYKLKNYGESLKYHEKALNLYKKKYGQIHAYVAQSCNNIARVLRSQNEYEKSTEFFLIAMDIMISLNQEKTKDYAILLSNIGNNYSKMKKINESIKYYQSAMDLIFTLEKDLKLIKKISKSIANSYQKLEDYASAIKYYERLYAILSEESRFEENSILEISLRLGKLYGLINDLENSNINFKRAIKLWIEKKSLDKLSNEDNQSEFDFEINNAYQILSKRLICAICLNDFNQEKEIFRLECDHKFHSECFNLRNSECILCQFY